MQLFKIIKISPKKEKKNEFHHEECIQVRTNMPSIGLAILVRDFEIEEFWVGRKYTHA